MARRRVSCSTKRLRACARCARRLPRPGQHAHGCALLGREQRVERVDLAGRQAAVRCPRRGARPRPGRQRPGVLGKPGRLVETGIIERTLLQDEACHGWIALLLGQLLALGLMGGITVCAAQLANPPAPTTPASKPRGPLRLVTWFGQGSIALPQGDEWKPELLTMYENGRRPVAQFSNDEKRVSMTFLLFENKTGTPTAQGCREDAINPIKKYGKVVYKRSDKNIKLEDGVEAATTAYTLDTGDTKVPQERNLFAFAGNATTCRRGPLVEPRRHCRGSGRDAGGGLSVFHPNVAYHPAALDYFRMGRVCSRRHRLLRRITTGLRLTRCRRVAALQRLGESRLTNW